MTFLIFGTMWFWLLVIIASISIICFMEMALKNDYKDNGGGFFSTLTIAAFIMLYYYFGSKEDVQNFFAFIKDHPFITLLRMGLYVVIGLAWSIFKWYCFLKSKKETLMAPTAVRIRNAFNEKLSDADIPKASRNKSRIISWMSYWPFSVFWFITNGIFHKSFRFLYTKVEKFFDMMSNRIFADIKTQIKKD